MVTKLEDGCRGSGGPSGLVAQSTFQRLPCCSMGFIASPWLSLIAAKRSLLLLLLLDVMVIDIFDCSCFDIRCTFLFGGEKLAEDVKHWRTQSGSARGSY